MCGHFLFLFTVFIFIFAILLASKNMKIKNVASRTVAVNKHTFNCLQYKVVGDVQIEKINAD